jgi:hypothetical protein
MPAPRPRRWPWIALAIAVGMVFVAFAADAFRRRALEARLTHELAELARADLTAPVLFGDPTDVDPLTLLRPHLERVSEVPDEISRSEPGPGYPLAQELHAAVDETLARARPALEALSRAARSNRTMSPYDYRAPLDPQQLHFQPLRQLASHAELAAQRLLADGDVEGAVRHLLEVVRFGQDIARRRLLIDYMVGLAIQAIGLDGIHEVMDRAALDDAALALVGRSLRRLRAAQPSAAEAHAGERLLFLSIVLDRSVQPEWRDAGYLERAALRWWWSPVEAHMRDVERALSEPFSRARRELLRLDEVRESSVNPLIHMSIGAVHVAEAAARSELMWIATETRAAWLRFLLRSGAPPAALGELVGPDLLGEVPRDPFAPDAPLGYHPGDAAIPAHLRSVGANGVDDTPHYPPPESWAGDRQLLRAVPDADIIWPLAPLPEAQTAPGPP